MSYDDDPELKDPTAQDDPSVQHYAGYCVKEDAQLGDPMTTKEASQHEVDLHKDHNPDHECYVAEYPFKANTPPPA